MNTHSRCRPAAELVVRLLPFVARHKEFALKGGTAIDFFVRAMPRLSVDIDLVWLSRAPRETALPAMRNALARLGRDIAAGVPGIRVRAEDARDGLRLALLAHGVRTKIEVNPVIRGSVWPSTVRPVHPAVEATMGYSENRLLSFDDLYAGKICAALDRQHPRDLFDIAVLLDNEGLRPSLIATFLIYLASHRRPAAELLEPNRKPIGDAYRNVFDGMALVPTSPEALADARERLIAGLHAALRDRDRAFLMSMENRRPDWSLVDLPDPSDLPALRWKLLNLGRMDPGKQAEARDRLERILYPPASRPRRPSGAEYALPPRPGTNAAR